jgi:IMP cyclohydrolase
MAYVGRICGLGRTIASEPALVYAITGRSTSSKQRIARLVDDDVLKTVRIETVGTPTAEQKAHPEIFTYNALLATRAVPGRWPYALVGNGVHINHMFKAVVKEAEELSSRTSWGVFQKWEAEPDSYHTPRITAEVQLNGRYATGAFYMVTTSGAYTMPLDNLEPGQFRTIATYTGENDEKPEAPEHTSLSNIVSKGTMEGETAQELASEFHSSLDPKFRVTTVAAVFSKGVDWDVAIVPEEKLGLEKLVEGLHVPESS